MLNMHKASMEAAGREGIAKVLGGGTNAAQIGRYFDRTVYPNQAYTAWLAQINDDIEAQ